ncbi:uncharacterized protein LOC129588430 [Paramacrobiotus metropolitanus]|uniref:uncharacterized protein LOC129588430 n=1 Tax=Paramacrobiotus metropolitanus TaxID=2943436 RepID=UPI00244587A0|nr:uncharacterized protein LOC129588430 [Paramacrobiotus metropolitanus]
MSVVTLQPLAVTTGQLHNRLAVVTFGALQMSFGILLVILEATSFTWFLHVDHTTVRRPSTAFGSGFWAGSYFLGTGISGILAGRVIPPPQGPRVRRGVLITSLVLSVLGLILAVAMSAFFCKHCKYLVHPAWVFSSYHLDADQLFVLLHATCYIVMVVVNLGQSMSTSVNLGKLPKHAAVVTYIMTQMPIGSDQQMTTTAIHADHTQAKTMPIVPTDLVPPPYSLAQQSYVQPAVNLK